MRYLLDEHIDPKYRAQLLRAVPDLVVWIVGDPGAPLRGTLDPDILTSATLLLAGGIAGIWDVSTAPSFRGHGYGSAITLAMMQEAHARGYQHAWVWSSTLGKRVYNKIGFVAADFGIREYQWKKR